MVPTYGGYAELVNRNSGQCLSCTGTPPAPASNWSSTLATAGPTRCGSSVAASGPAYDVNNWTATIQSMSSGLFADVYGASGSEGTGIDQWYWNGNWNQSWHFTQAIG